MIEKMEKDNLGSVAIAVCACIGHSCEKPTSAQGRGLVREQSAAELRLLM